MEELRFVEYEGEHQLPFITALMEQELSEPYSVFTYRYFLNSWPELALLAMIGEQCVGAIVCKLDHHKKGTYRGYIAMLAVERSIRKRGIGSKLVGLAIDRMKQAGCEEVVLETEITNLGALNLYQNLGFMKDKRLNKYYLNGVDAFRLKLWL